MSKTKYINLIILLIGIGCIPNLIKLFLGASSLGVGIVLIMTVLFLCNLRFIYILKSAPRTFMIFCYVIFIYSLFQHLIIGELNLRSYFSIPIVIYITMICYIVAEYISSIEKITLCKTLDIVVIILIFIGFFNIATGFQLRKYLGGGNGLTLFLLENQAISRYF